MITCDSIVRRSVRSVFSLTVLLLTATASAASPYCSSALPISLGETVRGDLRTTAPDCFRLETPASGLVMFDLAVPGTAAAEPRLALQRCDASARPSVIERSASHLLVAGDAASELTVCIGAQDPSQALGEFKLMSAFVEGAARKIEQVEADPDPFAGCLRKIEQVEADPDPFAGCLRKIEQVEADPDPFAGCLRKIEQVEADPDPFAGCLRKIEQVEADPDPFAEGIALDTLCRASDDHSDSLMCATPIRLDRRLAGEIDNGWGDDHDVFGFELTAATTVGIESFGEIDTFGGLYDLAGQRLAASDTGGVAGNFRLVRTLEPGVYFVRIEAADWARGAYSLAVTTVERSW